MDAIKWQTRKATVQAGEYPESAVEVTEHVSQDGAFAIKPTGGMKYCRENGVYGSMLNRWVWSGYRLTDHRPGLPAWVASSERHATVGQCKRAAERRLRRTQETHS